MHASSLNESAAAGVLSLASWPETHSQGTNVQAFLEIQPGLPPHRAGKWEGGGGIKGGVRNKFPCTSSQCLLACMSCCCLACPTSVHLHLNCHDT